MRLFELKTAILIIVLLFVTRLIAMNYVHPYFSINQGLQQAMLFDVLLDLIMLLITIVYFFSYLLKWNKGEAKLF